MPGHSTPAPEVKEIWAPDWLLDATRTGPELWWPVPDTDGYYEVSNQGGIRSWVTGTRSRGRASEPSPLTQSLNRDNGYGCVTVFYSDGRKRYTGVHVLVCETFIGPRPGPSNEWYAAHYNDDRSNNRLDNLRWAKPSVNVADQDRNGCMPRQRECREVGGVRHWRCTRCDTWKPESEFGPLSQVLAAKSRCKLRSECRTCTSARRRESRRRQKAA